MAIIRLHQTKLSSLSSTVHFGFMVGNHATTGFQEELIHLDSGLLQRQIIKVCFQKDYFLRSSSTFDLSILFELLVL